jgi:hypothetical protein
MARSERKGCNIRDRQPQALEHIANPGNEVFSPASSLILSIRRKGIANNLEVKALRTGAKPHTTDAQHLR